MSTINRVKTFDATGIAPGGRLYAGDLNAIQDVAAALSDFSQVVDVGSLRVGASDVIFSRIGAAQAQIAGSLRASAGFDGDMAKGVFPLLTSLPGTPFDGQIIRYQPEEGIIWPFRYNAGSTSAHKWEACGACVPVHVEDATSAEITFATQSLYIVGASPMSVTVPLAGDYYCEFSAAGQASSGFGVTDLFVKADVTSGGNIDKNAAYISDRDQGSPYVQTGRTVLLTDLTAAQTVKLQHRNPGGGGAWKLREINLWPKRVH